MIREMLKRLFCSHKNCDRIPMGELTLSDMDNMALGIRAYTCNDCGAKFFGKPAEMLK